MVEFSAETVQPEKDKLIFFRHELWDVFPNALQLNFLSDLGAECYNGAVSSSTQARKLLLLPG